MKNLIFIFFCLLLGTGYTQQSIPVHSIEAWNDQDSLYKVLFISADWCGYCKLTKKLLRKSKGLQKVSNGQFHFYEITDTYKQPVKIQDTIYTYQNNSWIEGHALIERFKDKSTESTSPCFPSFAVFNGKDELLFQHCGYLSESEWVSIFGAILNQIDSPPSVNNN